MLVFAPDGRSPPARRLAQNQYDPRGSELTSRSGHPASEATGDQPAPARFDDHHRLGTRGSGVFQCDQPWCFGAYSKAGFASGFGAYSLAFVAYTLATGVAINLSTVPALIRDRPDKEAQQQNLERAVSAGTFVGLVFSIALLPIGLLSHNPIHGYFILFGVLMPFLMLQALWRAVCFATRNPRVAALCDGIWLAVQGASSLVFALLGIRSALWYAASWGTRCRSRGSDVFDPSPRPATPLQPAGSSCGVSRLDSESRRRVYCCRRCESDTPIYARTSRCPRRHCSDQSGKSGAGASECSTAGFGPSSHGIRRSRSPAKSGRATKAPASVRYRWWRTHTGIWTGRIVHPR